MATKLRLLNRRGSLVLFISVLFILLIYLSTYSPSTSCPKHISNMFYQPTWWHSPKYIEHEQRRLRDMTTIIFSRWFKTIENNIPTVPCLSTDSHLLVLSVAASRVRYGVSVTFIAVYPTDVKRVLPKNTPSNPLPSRKQNLWCIFDDGSVTPVYTYDSNYGSERVSLLDCSLSPFAHDQLWKCKKTLRIFLASIQEKDSNIPILKAFIKAPIFPFNSFNPTQDLLTLCTSPLHDKTDYLIQWIEFHRLVGFRKFVIYNTTDNNNRLSSVINIYARKYPNLVDVVQWNFSSLGLIDPYGKRYFQAEALHDCLIRYGDRSEWLGTIDLDEYIAPLHPYETVRDYLHEIYGRQTIGSVILYSQFFCTEYPDRYLPDEQNKSLLTIERFIFSAQGRHKNGLEKYLYRPQFVQYLSIHHQIVGVSKQNPSEKHITLAHYAMMDYLRPIPGCGVNESIINVDIRDRYVTKVRNAIATLIKY